MLAGLLVALVDLICWAWAYQKPATRDPEMPAVNTLFNALANHPEFAKLDFSELLISNGGGMAVEEAVAKKWLAITGCPVVEGYGLSETSAGATCNPTDTLTFTGTIGLPMPNVDIRILDADF